MVLSAILLLDVKVRPVGMNVFAHIDIINVVWPPSIHARLLSIMHHCSTTSMMMLPRQTCSCNRQSTHDTSY